MGEPGRPAGRAAAVRGGDRTVEAMPGFAGLDARGAFPFDAAAPGDGAGGHDFRPGRPFARDGRPAIIGYIEDPERFPVTR